MCARFFILRRLDTESRFTALSFEATHIDIDPKLRVVRITTVANEETQEIETLIDLDTKVFPKIEDCVDLGCKHLVVI